LIARINLKPSQEKSISLYHAREFIDACYHQPLDLEQISRQAFFALSFLAIIPAGVSPNPASVFNRKTPGKPNTCWLPATFQ
jgi:hypothetical protein